MARDLADKPQSSDFDRDASHGNSPQMKKAPAPNALNLLETGSFQSGFFDSMFSAAMEVHRLAFKRLRKAIEDPDDTQTTWNAPRLNFEIEYNISDEAWPIFIQGIRAPDSANDQLRLSDAAHGYMTTAQRLDPVIDALSRMTALPAWLSHNGTFSPAIPEPYWRAYQAMDADEKAAFKTRGLSPVELRVDVHGAQKIFTIYPPVIDLDAECAWFTVTAEFDFTKATSLPSSWPDSQQEHLWLDAGNTSFDEPVTLLDGGSRAEVAIRLVPRADNREIYPIAMGDAIADAHSMALIQNAHKLRFPRSLKKIKQWSDIEADEIADLTASLFGDAASYRDEDLEAIGLQRTSQRGVKQENWPLVLTPKHKKKLRFEKGQDPNGFLDLDKRKRPAIYKSGLDNRGLPIEMWLTWDGTGFPLLAGDLKRTMEDIRHKLSENEQSDQLSLFQHMPDQVKDDLNERLRRLSLYDHGRRLMEVMLGAIAKGRQNPVTISASVFRDLFWLLAGKKPPKNWKKYVDDVLSACMALNAVWKSANKGNYGETSFIGDWEYQPAGVGRHGDGLYLISFQAPFVGCLSLFEMDHSPVSRTRKTPEPRPLLDNVTRYDFNKNLDKKDRKKLNYVKFDAGRPFYDAAAGLTAEQANLHRWLETEITLNKDTAHTKSMQVRKNAENADSPRLYDFTWCPLLPAGQFVGALGHFHRTPEAGRTLAGTRSKTGHVDGLIAVAGYEPKPGRAHSQREEIMRKVLQDLKAVAVEYLGGFIYGKLNANERTDDGSGVQWFRLEEFSTLDDVTLTKKVKLFIFLPADWKDRRKQKFEKKTGKRVTESPDVAQVAYQAQLSGPSIPAPATNPKNHGVTILPGSPVQNRLYGAMKMRKLKNVDIARIFHVDKATVGRWIYGMKLGQDDPSKSRRIPGDLAALMHRWVDIGQEPTLAELGALESRKRSPARKRA